VLWITGPHQSGKTTLSQLARPDLPYVHLERPDERAFATDDPHGLVAAYPDGAILDEIHYAPELTSWLKAHVDQDKYMGRPDGTCHVSSRSARCRDRLGIHRGQRSARDRVQVGCHDLQ
jgi:predicted AAA+ superfamily ATPase